MPRRPLWSTPGWPPSTRRGATRISSGAGCCFPIFEAGGRPVGAGGRLLPGGRGPKYKNTAGTAVYDKSRVLYGLNWAKKAVVERGRVVVCEGYTDVIGLQQAGSSEAVATCGTALAEGHIRLLTNFARRIVLAYDADAAGQAAAERLLRMGAALRGRHPGGGPAGRRRPRRPGPAGSRRALPARRGRGPALPGLPPRAALRAEPICATPESRARAAAEAMAMVAEHPNELVRDQYLMQVADRCRVEPDRLRQMAPAESPSAGGLEPVAGPGRPAGVAVSGRAAARTTGPDPGRAGPIRVAVGGPELEALRLAVHRPEAVADRLELVLFAHPLARACFEALSTATTLHDAIEAADPQAADLLQRLAVEDTDADADDVMVRLVRAGRPASAYAAVEAEMRQAAPAEQAASLPTVSLAQAHPGDASRRGSPVDRPGALEAEQRLVGWLVARDAAEQHTEAIR